jgi:hypothetical protein
MLTGKRRRRALGFREGFLDKRRRDNVAGGVVGTQYKGLSLSRFHLLKMKPKCDIKKGKTVPLDKRILKLRVNLDR